jgi:hypothetical protein
MSKNIAAVDMTAWKNQFTRHDLCDENHERREKARVQVLLEATDNKQPRE